VRPDVVAYALPPVFVLGGLGFIAFGAHVIRTARRLREAGQRVPGVVVRLRWDPSESGQGPGRFYPVLRFQTLDGTVIEAESDLGSYPAPAREGQPVTVVYDPAKPRRARLDTMLGIDMVHGPLFIAFGVVATLTAAAVTFFVYT
jgi:Protein of unknown function (DUF3592)